MGKIDYFPPVLKKELSKIMNFVTTRLNNLYPGAAQNEICSNIFGNPLCKRISESCFANFEYFGIFLTHESTLNRHMDYMNGLVEGYTYGASFSTVFNYDGEEEEHKGKKFRLTFIMTYRKVCDQAMKNMKII